MSHYSMRAGDYAGAAHCTSKFPKVSNASPADRRGVLDAVIHLFDGRSFLAFKDIEVAVGLSYGEIISLKQELIEALQVDVTSRIDLGGFYLEH